MTRALLDVNVLIALMDAGHVDHESVHAWAADGLADGWASCAITQNGFVRILSQPAYPGTVSVAEAIDLLRSSIESSHHEFWSCDIGLTETSAVDSTAVLGHRQITDAYLLALAVHHGGKLVTLDRSVPIRAVRGATSEHLEVIAG
ncbi:MAG: PIN domain-containing protein [Tetrasphaera jenkinsii]|jgi:toxin-antitoxin system PIN domain toxin|nr:PIN domain-containing protein [Tetrasphaera jenkinsii]